MNVGDRVKVKEHCKAYYMSDGYQQHFFRGLTGKIVDVEGLPYPVRVEFGVLNPPSLSGRTTTVFNYNELEIVIEEASVEESQVR